MINNGLTNYRRNLLLTFSRVLLTLYKSPLIQFRIGQWVFLPANRNMNGNDKLQLSNILQSMGDAFVSLDRDWRYTFINDKALTLMAKPKDALLGRSLWEAFPDIVGTTFEENYRKVMEHRVPVSFETYYPSYDMWLEIRAYAHEDGIAIFYTDISRHKKK